MDGERGAEENGGEEEDEAAVLGTEPVVATPGNSCDIAPTVA